MYGFEGYIFFAIIAVIVMIAIIKTAVVVPNQGAYVVERLGKFHTVLFAGFHILIPFIDKVAYQRSLKEQVLDVPEQMCITKDNVSVTIDGFLYLQVITPEKSAYGIDDFKYGAVQLAQTALRSAIGKMELDRTFEERANINQEVVEALDSATAPWGIKVLRYELRDIKPPQTVMEAMEKQMRAEREKRAVIAQSEGEMQSQKNLAEGAKAAAIAQSEGEMQSIKNNAEGEAAQIRTVATATAESIRMIANELDSETGITAAKIRLAESYIEQFGKMAKESNTMIIPSNVADTASMVASMMQIVNKTKD